MNKLLEKACVLRITGCINLEQGGADPLDHWVPTMRAVSQTQSKDIESDQCEIAMIWKELGLDERSKAQ
eukprot:1134381-Amphidinium_carterae.2